MLLKYYFYDCDFFPGSLVISPRSVIMLGGDNILISGPCFKSSDQIVCEFPSGKRTNGTYVSDIRAYCTVPILNVTGRLSIKLSVNGGKSFDFEGILSIGNDWVIFTHLIGGIAFLNN